MQPADSIAKPGFQIKKIQLHSTSKNDLDEIKTDMKNLTSTYTDKHKEIYTETKGQDLEQYKIRDFWFAHAYHHFIKRKPYQMLSFSVVLIALFLADIQLAVAPKWSDVYVLNIGLTFAFVFLLSELTLFSATHENYMFTFFFFLDVIATFSVVTDIPWMFLSLKLGDGIVLFVRGGRMGRTARAANSTRIFGKLLRVMRMVRLFRIAHFFKPQRSDADVVPNHLECLEPAKMGAVLSESVTQKVVIGCLLAFLVMPFFDAEQDTEADAAILGLRTLRYVYTNNHDSANAVTTAGQADFTEYWNNFYAAYPSAIYVQIASTSDSAVIVPLSLNDDAIRETAKQRFELDETTYVIMNQTDLVILEAQLNMGLTVFVMALFLLGSFVISTEAMVLVAPMEYLLNIVQKLSKHLTDQQHRKLSNIIGEPQVKDQEIVTHIVRQMADVFTTHRATVYKKPRMSMIRYSVHRMSGIGGNQSLLPLDEIQELTKDVEDSDDEDEEEEEEEKKISKKDGTELLLVKDVSEEL